jgi:hypothetical protein
MGFVEDEQKSYTEGMKAESASIEARRKKNKRLISVLLPLVILGGAMVIYDYLGRINTDDIFTEDKDAQRQIVEKWMRAGFIINFDVASCLCTFNEDRWRTYNEEEKIGITLMLGSYCAKTNGKEKSALTIRGSITGTTLATLGSFGVELR